MDDYIRREDALAVFGDLHPLDYNANAYYHKIQKIPSADVRPAVRGKWIWDDFGYHCSECYYHVYGSTGEVLSGEYKFCPHCGAEMEGEEDGE